MSSMFQTQADIKQSLRACRPLRPTGFSLLAFLKDMSGRFGRALRANEEVVPAEGRLMTVTPSSVRSIRVRVRVERWREQRQQGKS